MQVGAGALLCALALGLCGCLGGTGGEPSAPVDGPAGTAGSETRIDPTGAAGPLILLNGTLVRLPDGFAVNVSAHNAGSETLGHSRYPFDHPYQPAWSARLSGPPGEGLDYATPGQFETSYPMQTNQPMPPSAYVNWTFAGSSAADCFHRPSCANVWDGNLTLEGERVAAPPGDYTWRFTFTYSLGQSSSPQDRQAQHIDFVVQVPSSA